MKKKYFNNLENLRRRIDLYKDISSDNISDLLKKRKIMQKRETMISKLVPIEKLKDWKFKKKLFHKSKQFFSVEGVNVKKAQREVKQWDQLIFNQPHGGVLAFLVRETKKYGVEFLLCLRCFFNQTTIVVFNKIITFFQLKIMFRKLSHRY